MPDEREQRIDALVDSWMTNRTGTSQPQSVASTSAVAGEFKPPERMGLDSLYQKRNAEPGVPLDTSSEVGGWARVAASFRQGLDREVSFLQNKYGKESVRVTQDNNIIVRVMDAETGKPKDIPADNPNITLNDFIDIAGNIPEIAAGIVSLRSMRKLPGTGNTGKGFMGWARDTLSAVVGGETAGAAKDVAVDLYDTGETDMGAVIKDRAKMAGVDAAFGAVGGMAMRFLRFIRAPLHGGRGEIQFDGIGAQRYFKEKYGIDVPLSVGESTGSPMFSRGEIFIEKMPGGSGPIRELAAKREESMRSLQRKMMGMPVPDEYVGQRAIQEIDRVVGTAREGVEQARGQASQAASRKLDFLISRSTSPNRELYPHQVGAAVRKRVIELRDQAKETSTQLYDVVNRLPGGTGKVFETGALSEKASRLLQKLPTSGDVPMAEWAPPDVVGRLKSLAALKEQPLSLSELQQMRRDAYEAMGTTQGAPGRGEHYLNEIAKMITETIDEGAEKLGSGQLKVALQNANKHYREKVVPFNRVGITELFRDATESGLGDSAVAKRVINDPDRFRLYREALGEDSREIRALKRMVADDVLETSGRMPDGTVNAKAFIDRMKQFRASNRETFEAVFGKRADQIIQGAEMLSLSQADRVPEDALRQMFASGKTPISIAGLAAKQRKLDELYSLDIIKKAKSGELGDAQINPSEFVTRFIDNADPADVTRVLGVLSSNPGLVSNIRSKVVETIFRRAARAATPSDLARALSDDVTEIMSGTSIGKQLKDKNFREKIKVILGSSVYSDLENYIKLEATSEAREKAFAAAGGIAAGSHIANLLNSGPLKYATAAARSFVVSRMLTVPAMRYWLSAAPKELTRNAEFTKLILSSPIFLREVTTEFGEGAQADSFIGELNDSVDRFISENIGESANAPAGGNDRDARINQLLDGAARP